MCNAWNHPLNCTCGWGGDGQSGRSTFSNVVPAAQGWWPRALTSTYDSFVNPNASCPVCGAAVFFYQSSSGGRVFFDELGPPWPKHPCTDNSSRPGRLPSIPCVTTEASSYSWQQTGWKPFYMKSIIGIDKDFLKITGIWGDRSICLYIRRLVEHHLHTQAFSERNLAQVKANPDTSHEFSILLPNATPITLTAFLLLADARNDLTQRIKAKAAKRGGALTTAAAHSKKRPKALGRKPSRHSQQLGKTTMALAFKKAQEEKEKIKSAHRAVKKP